VAHQTLQGYAWWATAAWWTWWRGRAGHQRQRRAGGAWAAAPGAPCGSFPGAAGEG